ncbi:hypothetical protein ACMDB5_09720 [Flavobacterium sp. W1B]|uniref:hypothetical protein n=1 Tax=Flavobacterium sp. W1B TaxID=3394146 RepID=UPI0039BCE6DC
MIVLNDIELVSFMRALKLLKDREFLISYFYMGGNYLDGMEKQLLRMLDESGQIEIFELSNDFYSFCNNCDKEKLRLETTDISSVYYAKMNNLPLVTTCQNVKNFAELNNVKVLGIDEALKFVNSSQDAINFLNNMIKVI